VTAAAQLLCPQCRLPLIRVDADATPLHSCARCAGVWVDVESFQKLSLDVHRQDALTRCFGPEEGRFDHSDVPEPRPCASCNARMRRFVYAGDSGIHLDLCGRHGIWFDRDELRRVVRFIQSGGLTASLARRDAPPPLGLRSYHYDHDLRGVALIEMALELLGMFF
jgi:Zn-finger nucleic acid-binding protein